MCAQREWVTLQNKPRIVYLFILCIRFLSFWACVTLSLCAHFFFHFFCVLILICSISRKGVETEIDCDIKREHEFINDLIDTDQIPIDQWQWHNILCNVKCWQRQTFTVGCSAVQSMAKTHTTPYFRLGLQLSCTNGTLH